MVSKVESVKEEKFSITESYTFIPFLNWIFPTGRRYNKDRKKQTVVFQFHQHMHRVRLRNLDATDKKSSYKMKHKKFRKYITNKWRESKHGKITYQKDY